MAREVLQARTTLVTCTRKTAVTINAIVMCMRTENLVDYAQRQHMQGAGGVAHPAAHGDLLLQHAGRPQAHGDHIVDLLQRQVARLGVVFG